MRGGNWTPSLDFPEPWETDCDAFLSEHVERDPDVLLTFVVMNL